MVFHDPQTVDLFDKKILVELDYRNYIQRKKKDLRWGVEPDWYIEHIWKSCLTPDTLMSVGNFLQTNKNKTG